MEKHAEDWDNILEGIVAGGLAEVLATDYITERNMRKVAGI